jgi:HK97 family phage portal protein
MALNNFISSLKNMWTGTYNDYNDYVIPALITGTGIPFDLTNAEKVATVYTCIKILSETLSRMPLNVYTDGGEGRTVDKEDYRYPILHYQPNNWTSQQTFISALEFWRNLKGNSFARIYRDNSGKVETLVLVPPSKIKDYKITNNELYYTVINDLGEEEVTNSSEILHFKGLTRDGIWGINPLEALRLNLSASYQGIQAIDSFYRNNAMSPKAIKSTVSGSNQKAMLEALEEFNRKYVGALKAGTMVTLPPNSEIVDMALNFADAEFIATMKFNTQVIAALYGVPPASVGILEATKFNNVEQMMLDFKVQTLAAIGRMYRQEFESKLLTTQERLSGVSIEFNFNALLETDSTTRINNERTLQGMGVITPNDVCKLEGFPTYPEGDEHYMPGNYLPVSKIASVQPPIK